MPSESEVKQKGIDIAMQNKILLQKIEELTLYLIELKKENKSLEDRIKELENK